MSVAHPVAIGAIILGLVACDSVGVDVAPQADVDGWTEMLTAVNTLRAQGGTCGGEQMPPSPALIWDERLEAAARGHAADMAEHSYFGHTGSDGAGLGERVERTGYDWSVVGENLARHQRSVGEVVTDWQESEGHCRQIHDPAFAEVGAALVEGHWVQVFGYPRY